MFYMQIFYLGMGNCMSPICADILGAKLKKTCLVKTLTVSFSDWYVNILTTVPKQQGDNTLKY